MSPLRQRPMRVQEPGEALRRIRGRSVARSLDSFIKRCGNNPARRHCVRGTLNGASGKIERKWRNW